MYVVLEPWGWMIMLAIGGLWKWVIVMLVTCNNQSLLMPDTLLVTSLQRCGRWKAGECYIVDPPFQGIVSVDRPLVYFEGYLQAMLDSMFRQDYLKVKVTYQEVLLRNLPPNTCLVEEIMSAVKKFLVAKGLPTQESLLATARPT